MLLKTARDHVSWLFFPSRFLFLGGGAEAPHRHRVGDRPLRQFAGRGSSRQQGNRAGVSRGRGKRIS